MLQSVYLIKSADGNVKIGISQNPDARLKELHVGNSSNMQLLYESKPIYNAPKIEHMLHKKYMKQHVSGEWFKINDIPTLTEQIEEAIKTHGKFKKVVDPRGQEVHDAMKAHIAFLNSKADEMRDKAESEKQSNDYALNFSRCICGAVPEEKSFYTKLIYKMIFGKSLDELKIDFNVKEKESIREHMTAEQLQEVESLEMLISGLINIGMSYQEIKQFVEEKYKNPMLKAG